MTRLISITALLLTIVTPAFAHHRGHHHARVHHRYNHFAARSRRDRVSGHSDHGRDYNEASIGDRPRKIEGLLEFAGKVFDFVSGGAGWSIPLGDWEITGQDGVGSWGQRHGAIGIAGGEIYDPLLHRKREGIELHAGRYATEGCVAIKPQQWTDFKHRLMAALEHGKAYLHIGKDGAAIIPASVTAPITWGIIC